MAAWNNSKRNWRVSACVLMGELIAFAGDLNEEYEFCKGPSKTHVVLERMRISGAVRCLLTFVEMWCCDLIRG